MCKHCGDTRHRPGFNCPATKYQCKKCQKYGHFTSKCLTKAQNTNVNTVEEVTAILEFSESPHHVQAELSNNDSFDVMYICTVNASKPRRCVFADQLTMCNYKPDMESVLQCDIFLFSLNNQAFISKIISEESPDVTAATIRQKLKKLEAGRANAKYIKGTNATGKDPIAEGVNHV